MNALRPLVVLLSLAFALATFPSAGAMEDVTNPPECVRNGPPCGVDVEDLLSAADGRCVVGNTPSWCLVSVEMHVCVTEPCESPNVCVLYGAHCWPYP